MDILIVEDNRETLDALIRLFRRMGFQPRGVQSCRDALDELDRRPAPMVLTDWDLGGELNGIDIATHALHRQHSCVVMFCTGNSVRLLRQQTSHLNISKYFKKPVSLRELREQCQSVIGGE